MAILKSLIKIIKLILPDINEVKYILFNELDTNKKNLVNKNENFIFSGMETDYYSLCLLKTFKQDKYLPKGRASLYLPLLCFTKIDPKKKFFLHFILFQIKNLFIILRNFKYKILYRKSISNTLTLNNFNILDEYKYLNLSRKLLSKIKKKEQIKYIKIDKVNVGREIYDSYLRFSGNTTLNLNDFMLIEIVAKIFFMKKKLIKFIKKNNIKYYFSRQTAYIHHGCVANFLIKKQVKVFLTGSRNEYFYNYNGKHYHYPYDYRKYKKIFKSLKNKKKRLLEAKKILETRFKGIKPTQDLWVDNYQKHNPYLEDKKNKYKLNSKCIIFLHCFVDSPLMGGNIIFNDYAEWIIQTLIFLEKINQSKYVIIKPHPDAKPDSIKFERYLMKKFSKFKWLDRNSSNKEIFKNDLNIGLTVRGNVIPELAYHGVKPIAAGDNICQSFSFVFTPKDQKSYFNSIAKNINKNHKKEMKSKINEIYQLTYMSLIYNLKNKNYLAKTIELKKNINFNKSESLTEFIKLFKQKQKMTIKKPNLD